MDSVAALIPEAEGAEDWTMEAAAEGPDCETARGECGTSCAGGDLGVGGACPAPGSSTTDVAGLDGCSGAGAAPSSEGTRLALGASSPFGDAGAGVTAGWPTGETMRET